jgi:hypothetical protein
MSVTQPQLPAMQRDFTQPAECRGAELSAVIAEAQAVGYHAHSMTVLPEVVYVLRFYRLPETPAAGGGTNPSGRSETPRTGQRGIGNGHCGGCGGWCKKR